MKRYWRNQEPGGGGDDEVDGLIPEMLVKTSV